MEAFFLRHCFPTVPGSLRLPLRLTSWPTNSRSNPRPVSCAVEHITRDKVNGSAVNVGVDTSNVIITKLRLDKDRKSLLDCKAESRAAADNDKGSKFTSEDIMEIID